MVCLKNNGTDSAMGEWRISGLFDHLRWYLGSIIIAFCHVSFIYFSVCLVFFFFGYFCLHLFFFRSFSYGQGWTNDEHRTKNKREMFAPVKKKPITPLLYECMEINACHAHVFWVAQEVQIEAWGSERWLQEKEAIKEQDLGQCQVSKAGGV